MSFTPMGSTNPFEEKTRDVCSTPKYASKANPRTIMVIATEPEGCQVLNLRMGEILDFVNLHCT